MQGNEFLSCMASAFAIMRLYGIDAAIIAGGKERF
jgi:hypothetical protein